MNTRKIIQLLLIILLAFILFKLSSCEAGQVDDLLQITANAESNDGKFLYGDGGKSLGRYHICAAVVIDYNRANGTVYKHTDLLDNEVSEKIGCWHAWQIVYILERRGIYSVARFCFVWNVGLSAIDKPLPTTHKNLIYRGIYEKYHLQNLWAQN